MEVEIRPVDDATKANVRKLFIDYWKADFMVTKGLVHKLDDLRGFVAINKNEIVGFLTFKESHQEVELISLNSLIPGSGIGTLLLNRLVEYVKDNAKRRLWLMTTNDNRNALQFYQKRNWKLKKIYPDAITEFRKLKPDIPVTGYDGIEIRDELELEYNLLNMKIKLRPWTISDLDNLVKYANNWNVAKNLTDKFPFPYTATHGKDFIEYATRDIPIHIFAIDIDGEAVGGIGIHPQDDIHRRNAELGYWLAEPFWGQGIVSDAIKQVLDFAFSTYDIDRVFARPFGTNIPSQRVLEKNNFKLEGKFENVLIKDGEILDELIYAIRRKDWKK